ncbi:hypothetical protein LINPERPRIM_LOCUS8571 [Linum perenne]
MESKGLELFEVGPCEDGYQMGLLIGKRFGNMIRSRLSTDLILQNQLLPFAQTPQGQHLITTLSENNKNKFPRYWDELLGTAAGSGVPVLDVILINFRKEILPFLPKTVSTPYYLDTPDDCSDESFLAVHTDFKRIGQAFTLNSVPPSEHEIVKGGIGRNFVSRDLLEATSMTDALKIIHSCEVSVGHCYNLIYMPERKILNVETASKKRVSVYEVGSIPFFHANMYLHLQVDQVQDDNSKSRQERAAVLQKRSKEDFLSILGDMEAKRFPIYMNGPTLYTLCTVLIDLDKQTLSIIKGNPKDGEISHVFSVSSADFKTFQ